MDETTDLPMTPDFIDTELAPFIIPPHVDIVIPAPEPEPEPIVVPEPEPVVINEISYLNLRDIIEEQSFIALGNDQFLVEVKGQIIDIPESGYHKNSLGIGCKITYNLQPLIEFITVQNMQD